MSAVPWIIISVLGLVAILAVLAIRYKMKYRRPPDYYAFYVMGLLWTLVGIIAFLTGEREFNTLLFMGLIFLAMGLANKDKWESNRIRLGDMSAEERKYYIRVIAVLVVLALAGLAAFLLVEMGII